MALRVASRPIRPGEHLRTVMAAAVGASSGRAAAGPDSAGPPLVGTDHLLVGIAVRNSVASRLLERLGAGYPEITAALRGTAERRHDTEAEPAAVTHRPDAARVLAELRHRPATPAMRAKPLSGKEILRFTPAAERAVLRAVEACRALAHEDVEPEHLMLGLLAEPTSRAVHTLARLGTDLPETLRRGGALTSGVLPPAPAAEVDHPAGLRTATRPTLALPLGAGGLTGPAGAGLLRVPVAWAYAEAQRQASRLGHSELRAEHLFLAVLACHEAAHSMPRLLPADAGRRYLGGRVLASAGIDYTGALATLGASTSGDVAHGDVVVAEDVRDLVRLLGGGGTGELVLELIHRDHTEPARIVAALGASPADLRHRLAGAISG